MKQQHLGTCGSSERPLLPLCPGASPWLGKHTAVAGTQAPCRGSRAPRECWIHCTETPASPVEFRAVSPNYILDD